MGAGCWVLGVELVLNTVAADFGDNFSMRYTITPGDFKDALYTACMESLQYSDVVAVSSPGFTAAEECHGQFCSPQRGYCSGI